MESTSSASESLLVTIITGTSDLLLNCCKSISPFIYGILISSSTRSGSAAILLLRINAVFKRLGAKSDNTTTYRGMEILPHKGVIKYKDEEITLTKNEMTIFMYLLSHREHIVSRDELMTELWNNEEYLNDNALTVNISRLRGRFKDIGLEDVIETRKGQGYILV